MSLKIELILGPGKPVGTGIFNLCHNKAVLAESSFELDRVGDSAKG